MTGDGKERLEFSYENIGASSYLIIKAGLKEEILDYQVYMTACNNIEKLVKYDVKWVNGYAYCYYNITSRLELSFLLKRRKLTRDEFVKLLADIMRSITDSAGYLLSGSGFLLNPEYIFANPQNLEIAMIYVPIAGEGDVCRDFKNFTINLILQLVDIEETGSDNFLQRILAYVKNDSFNFSDFLKLLDSMLYNKEADGTGSCGTSEEQPAAKPEDEVQLIKDKNRDFSRLGPVLTVLLSQLVLAVIVILTVRFVKLPGKNPAINYLALLLIILSVDVMIFKKLFKEIKFTKSELTNKAEKSILPAEFFDSFDAAEFTAINDAEKNGGEPGIKAKPAAGNNTVLLGSIQTGFPVLKSRISPGIEDIIIDKPDFIIGRLKGQVDFESKSQAVGKIHAQLINRNKAWFLKDLNSVNGTFLNDLRISSNVEYQLKNGDNIAFANSEYVLTL